MQELIDALQAIADDSTSQIMASPMGNRLVIEALASLRDRKSDLALALELSLYADTAFQASADERQLFTRVADYLRTYRGQPDTRRRH